MAKRQTRGIAALYAAAVAASSALLFVVQPILAKAMLPRFGGAAAVWVACMLFFQVVLLLGYGYAFCLTRYCGARAQALAHCGVMAASLFALPLAVRADLGGGNPTVAILGLLGASVGLPYFVLSATSPLLQSWLAVSRVAGFPYRLFALSNAASLAALLAYPVAIEPALSTGLQMRYWSVGYVALMALLGAIAIGRAVKKDAAAVEVAEEEGAERNPWLWVALAACASVLWLAVTNYLGQQTAAMPFLWVIPMAVYLLSFILCFEADGWYRPALFRWLMPAAWIAICYRVVNEGSAGGLQWAIPTFNAALFVCCMFCHGELARSKPAPRRGLAFFYLMVASGGALGGVFVGLVAPNAFATFLELPIGVTGSVILALYFLYGMRSPKRLARLAVVAAVAFVVSSNYTADSSVVRSRNFYGALAIRNVTRDGRAARALYSGRTIHGLEFLDSALRRTPTAYYGVQSGAGLAMGHLRVANRRVAVVGLGAGTLAAYGRSGDFFRFFEINPAVIRAAGDSFDFLRDSAAATDIVAGDGRLMLEREPPHSFDVVVLDAFSDDAIPVHLLTVQAFAMYFKRLRPDGLLLIHLSNRYLDLSTEVKAVATQLGRQALIVPSEADASQGTEPADWAIVGTAGPRLDTLRPWAQATRERKVRAWTDEYSSLVEIWR